LWVVPDPRNSVPDPPPFPGRYAFRVHMYISNKIRAERENFVNTACRGALRVHAALRGGPACTRVIPRWPCVYERHTEVATMRIGPHAWHAEARIGRGVCLREMLLLKQPTNERTFDPQRRVCS